MGEVPDNNCKLIPFHKLSHEFREKCHQLLSSEFPGYVRYRLVPKTLHLIDTIQLLLYMS